MQFIFQFCIGTVFGSNQPNEGGSYGSRKFQWVPIFQKHDQLVNNFDKYNVLSTFESIGSPGERELRTKTFRRTGFHFIFIKFLNWILMKLSWAMWYYEKSSSINFQVDWSIGRMIGTRKAPRKRYWASLKKMRVKGCFRTGLGRSFNSITFKLYRMVGTVTKVVFNSNTVQNLRPQPVINILEQEAYPYSYSNSSLKSAFLTQPLLKVIYIFRSKIIMQKVSPRSKVTLLLRKAYNIHKTVIRKFILFACRRKNATNPSPIEKRGTVAFYIS